MAWGCPWYVSSRFSNLWLFISFAKVFAHFVRQLTQYRWPEVALGMCHQGPVTSDYLYRLQRFLKRTRPGQKKAKNTQKNFTTSNMYAKRAKTSQKILKHTPSKRWQKFHNQIYSIFEKLHNHYKIVSTIGTLQHLQSCHTKSTVQNIQYTIHGPIHPNSDQRLSFEG